MLCVVKIASSDGAVGYGQTAPFSAEITQIVRHRQIADLALGEDDPDFSLATRIIIKLHKFGLRYLRLYGLRLESGNRGVFIYRSMFHACRFSNAQMPSKAAKPTRSENNSGMR